MQGYIFSLIVRVMNNIPIIRFRRKKSAIQLFNETLCNGRGFERRPKGPEEGSPLLLLSVGGGGSLAVLKV